MASPVLGIDLGTTNSVVAVVVDGKVALLTDEQGQFRFPSVVTLSDTNTIWVGTKAKAIGATSPGRMISAAKRLIGRRFSDQVVQRAIEMYPYEIKEHAQDESVRIRLGNDLYAPEDISSMILKHLKEQAERQFGLKVEDAVITVPAYFNHAQRDATQKAAQAAGLSVLRLLNEPTAAALSLYLGDQRERVVAVYDFGGGTFDVSIIRVQDRVCEVLATAGDTFLGGDDIDGLIAKELARDFESTHGVKLRAFPLSWHRLRDAAENAKKELSQSAQCSIYLPRLLGPETLATELTRTRLDELVRPLIDRSLDICRGTLSDAKLDKIDLTDIILIGGQTRMPLMKQRVEDFFGQHAPAAVNPDTSVADGAAKEAAMLKQGAGILLLDVTPMTLGINILGNRLYPIISKNTKIPVRKEHVFTTQHEGQKKAKIMILQGENTQADQNIRLGELLLSNLQDQNRFSAKINVVFEIDASGILHVKVTDEHSQQEKEITIKETSGKSDKGHAPQVPGPEAVVETEPKGEPSLSGPFSRTELPDVLYFLNANNKTGRLEIRSGQARGHVFLKDGEITHAKLDDASGKQALFSLLGFSDGHYFFMENAQIEEPREIDQSFLELFEEEEIG